MNMKLGSELTKEVQEHLKRVFVYRITGEHQPSSAHGDKPQFKDDADWLAHTSFAVTKAGKLDRRVNHCESYPTWPNGKPSGYSMK